MANFKQEIIRLEKELSKFPTDVGVLAADLFDQNFEKKSFFGQDWEPSPYVKQTRSGGALLQKTGRLRRSVKYQVKGQAVIFSSNAPYASIHNEGGTIDHPGGTAYFYNKKKSETIWISNRKAAGKKYPRTKPHKIDMPQRQFIGEHPELIKEVEKEFDNLFKNLGFK